MKTGADAIGTAENEFGRAKHENGTGVARNGWDERSPITRILVQRMIMTQGTSRDGVMRRNYNTWGRKNVMKREETNDWRNNAPRQAFRAFKARLGGWLFVYPWKISKLSSWVNENKYQLLIIKHKKEERERAREMTHWSEEVAA
jgi:hypothetical protein